MIDKKEELRLDKITIEWKEDDCPDVSYLETTIDQNGKIHSCRYTQEELEDCPKLTRRYIKEDMERLSNFGKTWVMLSCVAKAEVSYPINESGDRRIETFRSGGLYGVESDSDSEYLKEVEKEQIEDLKQHLEHFNVDLSSFEKKVEEAERIEE